MRLVIAEGAARRQQHARAHQHLLRLQPPKAACISGTLGRTSDQASLQVTRKQAARLIERLPTVRRQPRKQRRSTQAQEQAGAAGPPSRGTLAQTPNLDLPRAQPHGSDPPACGPAARVHRPPHREAPREPHPAGCGRVPGPGPDSGAVHGRAASSRSSAAAATAGGCPLCSSLRQAQPESTHGHLMSTPNQMDIAPLKALSTA